MFSFVCFVFYGSILHHITDTISLCCRLILVLYYFFSIDATLEPTNGPVLGRLVNHGAGKSSNVKLRVVEDEGSPFLCLFASKDIETGTELLYDYGVPLEFKQDEMVSCMLFL